MGRRYRCVAWDNKTPVIRVSTACLDWKERLIQGRSLVPALDLDQAEADRSVRIFNRLRLSDVIDTPRIGDVVGDWYRDGVRALFGSYDPVTKIRRIATVHMILPKKQGKTTLSGGTMLTALMMNKRPNARFGLFGGTQKIAVEAYDAAAGMVEADKKLQRFIKTTDHIKTIEHRLTGAYLEITSFDPKIATGGKFAGALIDELHVLGSMAKADRVIGQIRGARVALTESFMWLITTQSEERPAGVFASELKYARRVRDGEIDDPSYLPIIYEFPEEIQSSEDRKWENPEIWHQVMPSLGVAVSRQVLEDQYKAEKLKGEADVRRWASQHLNIQIGIALANDRWAGADYWEKAVESAVTLERLLECCEVITIGIDGGGLDDLLSLYVIGREASPDKDVRFRRWFGWGHSWAFSDPVNKAGVLERRLSEVAKLRDFEAAGELTIFTRMGDDIEEMVAIIKTVFESGKLAMIGLDPVGVGAVVDAITDADIKSDGDEEMIGAVSQGYKLMGAIKTAERKLADGTLMPADQAIMAWAVGNARNEQKGNAMMITKQKSGTAKIDPLMAMFDAIALMSTNPAAPSRSYLEKEPLLIL